MGHHAAAPREVRELFERVELLVDPLVVERILELGASVDEISEAIDVASDAPLADPAPSNRRVAEVRAILADVLDEDALSDDEFDRSGRSPARARGPATHRPPSPTRPRS
ncbi:MAG: hypothetical protein KF773_23800 [Deltaproteobacteria bacterium]|nr:hypothetical protein [Deltaproteobacteria bacterium]